jgi:hypothetical protein
MLPSLWLNALVWDFLYFAVLASAGRSGYNGENQTQAATEGQSGYDNEDQIQAAADGRSSYSKHKRSTWTGNWTTAHCTHIAVRNPYSFTAGERWSMLDCDHAWSDALDVWRTQDRGKKTFSKSIWDTFQAPKPAMCQTQIGKTNCDKWSECLDDPGAAGYEVLNSLVRIHGVSPEFFLIDNTTWLIRVSAQLYKFFYSEVYYERMPAAKGDLDNKLTFLDRAEDPAAVQSLLDFITLGIVTVSAFHITDSKTLPCTSRPQHHALFPRCCVLTSFRQASSSKISFLPTRTPCRRKSQETSCHRLSRCSRIYRRTTLACTWS